MITRWFENLVFADGGFKFLSAAALFTSFLLGFGAWVAFDFSRPFYFHGTQVYLSTPAHILVAGMMFFSLGSFYGAVRMFQFAYMFRQK